MTAVKRIITAEQEAYAIQQELGNRVPVEGFAHLYRAAKQPYTPQLPCSASQLAVFRECPRKWAYRYILGWRPPPQAGAIVGKLGHMLVEHYYQTLQWDNNAGENGELSRRVLPGIRYLPRVDECDDAPSSDLPGGLHDKCLLIETPLQIDPTLVPGCEGLDDVQFRGAIDVLAAAPNEPWRVYDHKFLRSWDYQKDTDTLREDEQSILYGLHVLQNCADASGNDQTTVPLRWVTYLTDPKAHPEARPVDLELNAAHILPRAAKLIQLGDQLRHVKQLRPLPTVEQFATAESIDSCEAYGTCPYWERHRKGREFRPGPCPGSCNKQSFGARLSAAVKEPGPKMSTAPTTTPAPAPAGTVDDLMRQLDAMNGGAPPPPPAPGPQVVVHNGQTYAQQPDGSWQPVAPSPHAPPVASPVLPPESTQLPVPQANAVAVPAVDVAAEPADPAPAPAPTGRPQPPAKKTKATLDEYATALEAYVKTLEDGTSVVSLPPQGSSFPEHGGELIERLRELARHGSSFGLDIKVSAEVTL